MIQCFEKKKFESSVAHSCVTMLTLSMLSTTSFIDWIALCYIMIGEGCNNYITLMLVGVVMDFCYGPLHATA